MIPAQTSTRTTTSTFLWSAGFLILIAALVGFVGAADAHTPTPTPSNLLAGAVFYHDDWTGGSSFIPNQVGFKSSTDQAAIPGLDPTVRSADIWLIDPSLYPDGYPVVNLSDIVNWQFTRRTVQDSECGALQTPSGTRWKQFTVWSMSFPAYTPYSKSLPEIDGQVSVAFGTTSPGETRFRQSLEGLVVSQLGPAGVSDGASWQTPWGNNKVTVTVKVVCREYTTTGNTAVGHFHDALTQTVELKFYRDRRPGAPPDLPANWHGMRVDLKRPGVNVFVTPLSATSTTVWPASMGPDPSNSDNPKRLAIRVNITDPTFPPKSIDPTISPRNWIFNFETLPYSKSDQPNWRDLADAAWIARGKNVPFEFTYNLLVDDGTVDRFVASQASCRDTDYTCSPTGYTYPSFRWQVKDEFDNRMTRNNEFESVANIHADATRPGPVTNLKTTVVGDKINLTWTNPTTHDFVYAFRTTGGAVEQPFPDIVIRWREVDANGNPLAAWTTISTPLARSSNYWLSPALVLPGETGLKRFAFEVIARDDAKNSAKVPATITGFVDRDPPTFGAWTAPVPKVGGDPCPPVGPINPANYRHANLAFINFTASDGVGIDVVNTKITIESRERAQYWTGTGWSSTRTLLSVNNVSWTPSTGTWGLSYKGSEFSSVEGMYILTAIIRDVAGNEVTVPPACFIRDGVKPFIRTFTLDPEVTKKSYVEQGRETLRINLKLTEEGTFAKFSETRGFEFRFKDALTGAYAKNWRTGNDFVYSCAQYGADNALGADACKLGVGIVKTNAANPDIKEIVQPTFKLPVTNVVPGAYRLELRAYDEGGNVASKVSDSSLNVRPRFIALTTPNALNNQFTVRVGAAMSGTSNAFGQPCALSGDLCHVSSVSVFRKTDSNDYELIQTLTIPDKDASGVDQTVTVDGVSYYIYTFTVSPFTKSIFESDVKFLVATRVAGKEHVLEEVMKADTPDASTLKFHQPIAGWETKFVPRAAFVRNAGDRLPLNVSLESTSFTNPKGFWWVYRASDVTTDLAIKSGAVAEKGGTFAKYTIVGKTFLANETGPGGLVLDWSNLRDEYYLVTCIVKDESPALTTPTCPDARYVRFAVEDRAFLLAPIEAAAGQRGLDVLLRGETSSDGYVSNSTISANGAVSYASGNFDLTFGVRHGLSALTVKPTFMVQLRAPTPGEHAWIVPSTLGLGANSIATTKEVSWFDYRLGISPLPKDGAEFYLWVNTTTDGRSTSSAAQSFNYPILMKVDSAKPTFNMSTANLRNVPTALHGTASDAGSGPASVELMLKNNRTGEVFDARLGRWVNVAATPWLKLTGDQGFLTKPAFNSVTGKFESAWTFNNSFKRSALSAIKIFDPTDPNVLSTEYIFTVRGSDFAGQTMSFNRSVRFDTVAPDVSLGDIRLMYPSSDTAVTCQEATLPSDCKAGREFVLRGRARDGGFDSAGQWQASSGIVSAKLVVYTKDSSGAVRAPFEFVPTTWTWIETDATTKAGWFEYEYKVNLPFAGTYELGLSVLDRAGNLNVTRRTGHTFTTHDDAPPILTNSFYRPIVVASGQPVRIYAETRERDYMLPGFPEMSIWVNDSEVAIFSMAFNKVMSPTVTQYMWTSTGNFTFVNGVAYHMSFTVADATFNVVPAFAGMTFTVLENAPPVVTAIAPVVSDDGKLPWIAGNGTARFQIADVNVASGGITATVANALTPNKTVDVSASLRKVPIMQGNLTEGWDVALDLAGAYADNSTIIVTVRARDAYNETAVANTTVRVDKLAPEITLQMDAAKTRVVSGKSYALAGATISASAQDAGSGLVAGSLEYQVDSGGWKPYTQAVQVNGTGSRVYAFRASDLAGNVGTSSRTIDVDTTPPRISDDTRTRDRFSIRVTDVGSGVDAENVFLYWTLENEDVYTKMRLLDVGGSFLGNLTPDVSGRVWYYVTAVDLLGNSAELGNATSPRVLDTSNHAPTLAITAPKADAVTKGVVRFEWTTADVDGDQVLVSIEVKKELGSFESVATNLSRTFHAFNTTGYDGRVTLRVTATDGAFSEVREVSFLVNNALTVKPRPVQTAAKQGQPMTLVVAIDNPYKNVSGVDAILYRKLAGGGETALAPIPLDAKTNGSYSTMYTPATLGDYRVEYRVTYGDKTTESADGGSFRVSGAGPADPTTAPPETTRTGTVPLVSLILLGAAAILLGAYAAFWRWPK